MLQEEKLITTRYSAASKQQVMEEPTKVSSEDLPNKEDDDTTSDGGFVKVEKEGIYSEYDDEKRSSSGSLRELQESQEKAKELELELEKVTGESNRYESENTLLKDELFSTKVRLEETEKKHEELITNLEQDLKSLTSQIEEYQDLGNVSSLRITEVEGLLETSQLKLEKAEEKLKELEAFQVKNSSLEASLIVAMEKEKELLENLKSAEERLDKQARKIDEATKRVRLFEDKLAEASGQSVYLKEELEQSSSENELLADTNSQLKDKIQELEGFLDLEKETATERFNQRDKEAKDLFTKLKSHETLIEEYKRQALEADTRKMELQERIKELEKENGDLADVNIKINQELANQGSETGDLQTKVSALEAEFQAEFQQRKKEFIASKTSIENLTNRFTSEGERLQSQISSLAQENNQVNEMYQSTKNELVKLQEFLQVEKSKTEAMVSEKSVLESKLEEVEKHLTEEMEKVAELTSKLQEEEHKVSESQEVDLLMYLELKDDLRKSQDELEAKNSMIVLLESLYKELEQKVQLADASHSSSTRNVTIQKTETSQLMTLKIVLGVALVSIIIGIILGKKY